MKKIKSNIMNPGPKRLTTERTNLGQKGLGRSDGSRSAWEQAHQASPAPGALKVLTGFVEKQLPTSLRILHGPFPHTAPFVRLHAAPHQGDSSINSHSQFKGVGAASNPNGTAPRLPWQRSRAALKHRMQDQNSSRCFKGNNTER